MKHIIYFIKIFFSFVFRRWHGKIVDPAWACYIAWLLLEQRKYFEEQSK